MPLYMRKDMDRLRQRLNRQNVLPANGKSVRNLLLLQMPRQIRKFIQGRQKPLGASLSDGSLILVLYDKNCFFLSAPLLFPAFTGISPVVWRRLARHSVEHGHWLQRGFPDGMQTMAPSSMRA